MQGIRFLEHSEHGHWTDIIHTVFQEGDTPTHIDNLVNSQQIFKILSLSPSVENLR